VQDLLAVRANTVFTQPAEPTREARAGSSLGPREAPRATPPAGTVRNVGPGVEDPRRSGRAASKTPADQGAAAGSGFEAEPSAAGRDRPEGPDGTPLSPEQAEEVERLQKRDREVREHERAHKAAAGRHGGAVSFRSKRGPDGRMYAVEGEVDIDVAPVKGDPKATIRKMRQVQRAARAPREPSAQDRRVAARAAAEEQKARRQMNAEATAEAARGPGESVVASSPGGTAHSERNTDGSNP